jgi:hypothetical protein
MPHLFARTARPLLLLSLCALSLAAAAQPSGGGQGGQQQPPAPPAEALTACKSLSSGAACSFTGQKGKETGTCFTPSSDKPLACRPAGGGQGPSQQR